MKNLFQCIFNHKKYVRNIKIKAKTEAFTELSNLMFRKLRILEFNNEEKLILRGSKKIPLIVIPIDENIFKRTIQEGPWKRLEVKYKEYEIKKLHVGFINEGLTIENLKYLTSNMLAKKLVDNNFIKYEVNTFSGYISSYIDVIDY